MAILKFLKCSFVTQVFVGVVSFLALAAAFASEAFLGLEPCKLCIYQRWPYALVIAFTLIALGAKKALMKPALALSGVSFLGNAGIAFYHTGVEQKWWVSAVEGCAVPQFSDAPQSILENIMSAPTARCDEIPWQDPLIGLSMANYNIAMGLGLTALCFVSLWLSRHTKSGEACHKS